MKKILLGAMAYVGITGSATAGAHITTDSRMYANQISARNIGAIQQMISTATFAAYDNYAIHTGHTSTTHTQERPEKATKLYGTLPMYGTAPLYGEWNAEVDIAHGRSGGDTPTPQDLNLWLRWTRGKTEDKFNSFRRLDTRNDLFMGGLGGNRTKIGAGYLKTGAFGGYINARQRNKYIRLDEQGGFIGLYAGYNMYRARTSATVTLGKIGTEMPHKIGGNNYDNTWADISLETVYDIPMNTTMTLQPGLRIGYTWIKSDDYVTLQHIKVTNDNFNLFLISPQMKAIKNIGDGWSGMAHIRYTLRKDTGGDVHTSADTKVRSMDTGDYIEYGIGVEKIFGRINISANLNRQDGARRGWVGGAHIKYVF